MQECKNMLKSLKPLNVVVIPSKILARFAQAKRATLKPNGLGICSKIIFNFFLPLPVLKYFSIFPASCISEYSM